MATEKIHCHILIKELKTYIARGEFDQFKIGYDKLKHHYYFTRRNLLLIDSFNMVLQQLMSANSNEIIERQSFLIYLIKHIDFKQFVAIFLKTNIELLIEFSTQYEYFHCLVQLLNEMNSYHIRGDIISLYQNIIEHEHMDDTRLKVLTYQLNLNTYINLDSIYIDLIKKICKKDTISLLNTKCFKYLLSIDDTWIDIISHCVKMRYTKLLTKMITDIVMPNYREAMKHNVHKCKICGQIQNKKIKQIYGLLCINNDYLPIIKIIYKDYKCMHNFNYFFIKTLFLKQYDIIQWIVLEEKISFYQSKIISNNNPGATTNHRSMYNVDNDHSYDNTNDFDVIGHSIIKSHHTYSDDENDNDSSDDDEVDYDINNCRTHDDKFDYIKFTLLNKYSKEGIQYLISVIGLEVFEHHLLLITLKANVIIDIDMFLYLHHQLKLKNPLYQFIITHDIFIVEKQVPILYNYSSTVISDITPSLSIVIMDYSKDKIPNLAFKAYQFNKAGTEKSHQLIITGKYYLREYNRWRTKRLNMLFVHVPIYQLCKNIIKF